MLTIAVSSPLLSQSIFHCSRSQLEHIADTLWKPLFDDAETSDEATRSIVASCIGKLTTSNPAKYLPQLEVRPEDAVSVSQAQR